MTSPYSCWFRRVHPKMSKHVSLANCDEIHPDLILVQFFFAGQKQVPTLVGLQSLATHGLQWQFVRRRSCVYVTKGLTTEAYRKNCEKRLWRGRSWIRWPKQKKTTKGDALGLRFCFPSFKGDNMTETPRIGLLRAFQPYGLDSNHWNVFFLSFLEVWFRKRLWQSRQHGEAFVSFGMFKQDEFNSTSCILNRSTILH